MDEQTRRKIVAYLAKQPPIELSFSPLELFVILEILLQTLAVTKIFERQVHFFGIKIIANLNLRYPKVAKVIRAHWISTINSREG
ncbi:MAG: hypothetical protein F6K48_14310 [Okeania sp. SIO3H1]|uniref:hypothetical protein n=1 Tax=Okeania sp. SIO1I7 TaxID=2607772 RepID=UPI0013CBFA0C|nr:hypothetical protein [Okeania sp. SIO1I7]NEN90019.1 hypothetical protein [Okeania sp. SIO3H1]NET24966.1 hypothetical protein [Okeania sp. SIO1I7]